MERSARVTAARFIEALNSTDCVDRIHLWDATGQLAALFPEIGLMKRSAKKYYFHPDGLWQHARETLACLEKIVCSLKTSFPRNHSAIAAHIRSAAGPGMTRVAVLRLVSLFHDAAKPSCASLSGGRMRFIGHEKQGARLMTTLCRRLHIDPKVSHLARLLVEQHMRPVSLTQAAAVTPRAANRLFSALGPATPDLLLLALADWHSYKRLKTHDRSLLRRQEATVRGLMAHYYTAAAAPPRKRLVDGRILMETFHLPAGPVIGELLRRVEKAHAGGKISTRAAAIALLRRQLTPVKKKYRIQ